MPRRGYLPAKFRAIHSCRMVLALARNVGRAGVDCIVRARPTAGGAGVTPSEGAGLANPGQTTVFLVGASLLAMGISRAGSLLRVRGCVTQSDRPVGIMSKGEGVLLG
jgi:hypothetical protein